MKPITRTFKPSVEFKIGLTPQEKRDLIQFMRFRNYKDRVGGSHVRSYFDALADDEIQFLRLALENSDRRYIGLLEYLSGTQS